MIPLKNFVENPGLKLRWSPRKILKEIHGYSLDGPQKNSLKNHD